MAALPLYMTVGEAARRAGVATSALRYYESIGLITSERTTGNQRRFHRSMLRRISVIRAAQGLGLSLDEIAQALSTLPRSGAPTKRDWERLSRAWRSRLDRRIEELAGLRDKLSACIGCGCEGQFKGRCLTQLNKSMVAKYHIYTSVPVDGIVRGPAN